MTNYFAVICNDHKHRIAVMRHYIEKYPVCIFRKIELEIQVGTSVFLFVTRDSNVNELGAYHLLGVIFPPGYEQPNLYELTAITRARW